MPDTHNCTLLRKPEDADQFHEFLLWLTAGGMDDLREISRFATAMRTAQKSAIGAVIVMVFGSIAAIIAAGVNSMFRGGGQ